MGWGPGVFYSDIYGIPRTKQDPGPEPEGRPWWLAPEASWHPPEPALLTWLLAGEPRESEYAKTVRAAFGSSRLLLGRAASEAPDGAGRRILARTIRQGQAAPILIDHLGPSVGTARLIPRPDRADVLALCVLDDSPRGRMAARTVAQGVSGLSVNGHQSLARSGGWRQGDVFTVVECSLVGSPADDRCRVLGVNHPRFLDFATHVLNIDRKEFS